MQIIRASDMDEVGAVAAGIIAEQIQKKPDSVLGLATGGTPLGIYRNLVRMYKAGNLDFSGIRTINLDEYVGLSAQHQQSYTHYMHSNLFSHINILHQNIHLPDGTAQDVLVQCQSYDAIIRSLGEIDLQLLGIGHNGHIGFNEPADCFKKGTHCVDLSPTTIAANSRFFGRPEDVPRQAFTVGMETILGSKKILMVAIGPEKANIIKAAFCGPITPLVPASILQLHPNLVLVADESALSELI